MLSNPICPNSLLPYSAHDEDIIRLLAMPVTGQMVQYIAQKLIAAVDITGHQHLPTPPVTPVRGKFVPDTVTCAPEFDFPPLETFLTYLIFHSNIHTASVLGSMIYLKRITRALQSGLMKHGPETPYRLAVALFVIASKYNHDSSPATIHWAIHVANALGIDATSSWRALEAYEARRAARRGKGRRATTIESNESDLLASPSDSAPLGYMFGASAITALERDLLHLLDYDLWFSEDELRDCLNALSTHPRCEGPLEQMRISLGRPSREFVLKNKEAYTMAMRRSISPLKSGLGSTSSYNPLTPTSPQTPLEVSKSGSKKVKRCLGLHTELAQHPNPWSHTPYPQLNPDMNVDYLSNLLNKSKSRNTLVPLGVPAVPTSTPAAGIDSLPFIYGGKTQPNSPVCKHMRSRLIVPPQEDSPWKHGQVGEILRKTMERQAKQLAAAAAAASRPRALKLLDTPPPPVSAFGSGMLYLQDSRKSSVEPVAQFKPSAWGCLLGESPLEARPTSGFKADVEKWTKARLERLEKIDGMPSGAPLTGTRSPPHFRGVVESGPANLLNTHWDQMQAWLPAHQEESSDEAFRTTLPLRVVDKSSRRCEVVARQGNRPLVAEDSGISYLPAPTTPPLQPSKSSWFARLLGGGN